MCDLGKETWFSFYTINVNIDFMNLSLKIHYQQLNSSQYLSILMNHEVVQLLLFFNDTIK